MNKYTTMRECLMRDIRDLEDQCDFAWSEMERRGCERDEAREALRDCVWWAESVSRRVTEDRESINWTGLQKAREVLGRLTDHKLASN